MRGASIDRGKHRRQCMHSRLYGGLRARHKHVDACHYRKHTPSDDDQRLTTVAHEDPQSTTHLFYVSDACESLCLLFSMHATRSIRNFSKWNLVVEEEKKANANGVNSRSFDDRSLHAVC